MPLAVIAALNAEIQTLVQDVDGAIRDDVAGWGVWVGRLHGQEVVLARAGVGKVNTGALAAVLWERYRPETFLFTGVAGSLDPDLLIGDIVVGERTIQHDWGTLASGGLERYQAGHLPFYNPTYEFGYAPSVGLISAARAVADSVDLTPVDGRVPRVAFGTILTGDQFLQDEKVRAELHRDLGGHAIEMEGAALGQVADRLGADHLVFRSMSDLASGESVEHFERFVPQVAANSARVVSELIRAMPLRSD